MSDSKMLADILADYLTLIGNDPDRRRRTRVAAKGVKAGVASLLSDAELYAEVGKRRSAMRGDAVGGRPPVLAPCEHCGREFGARAMRGHLPDCPKRK